MLRLYKAAKTLCTVIHTPERHANYSDHEWTVQGKICQVSSMGFWEKVKGIPKPISSERRGQVTKSWAQTSAVMPSSWELPNFSKPYYPHLWNGDKDTYPIGQHED